MSRKNIFEILKGKYDINREITKITTLFEQIQITATNPLTFKSAVYSIEKICDIFCFPTWKQRSSYLGCEEMRLDLQLPVGNKLQPEGIIKCLEYYINILTLIQDRCNFRNNLNFSCPQLFWMLIDNIDILLENLNYEKIIFDDEEKVILVPKDPAAIAASEITKNKDISFAILKYNHASLKGDLESKKQLLLSIANEYEPVLKNPQDGFKDYFEKANFLLNNIHLRHNNKTGKDKKQVIIDMPDKELENWYDELYQLLLFCVLIKDNVKRKDAINELLQKLRNK